MVEFLFAAALVALSASSVVLAGRGARRRSRARAERVLDDLAADACAALARDERSRRCARTLDRYARTRERVVRARTCRELELVVARHRLRRGAEDLAAQGAGRLRAFLAEGIAARR